MDTTGKQEGQNAPAYTDAYGATEDTIRALETLLYEMENGKRDPEEIKKEVEAAGEAYGRAVDYLQGTDDVDTAREICQVMGITDKTPAGSRVVEFLQEKARVLSTAEHRGDPRPRRYGSCYGGIIKAIGRLYSWLYRKHPGVLTGEAGKPKKGELAPELQEPGAKRILDAAVKAGLLNKDYSPTDKLPTKVLRAYFAQEFSKAAGWRDAFGKPQPKYAPFERLWEDKGFGRLMYNKRVYNGKTRGAEVVDIFFGRLKH